VTVIIAKNLVTIKEEVLILIVCKVLITRVGCVSNNFTLKLKITKFSQTSTVLILTSRIAHFINLYNS